MKEQMVIFGIGYEGKWFINEIGKENVECIIDNNSSLWGSTWNGIPIISLEGYLENKISTNIVISSCRHVNDISNQLVEHGINNFTSYAKVWIDRFLIRQICHSNTPEAKRVFLMNVHSYSNIGDYAITYAETQFLKKYCNICEPILIPACICRDGLKYLIEHVDTNDIILISGGGYLGNIWMDCGENNVREIVKQFSENDIIIFPQSIFYTEDIFGKEEKKISKSIYSKAKQLTICVRESASLQIAKEIFNGSIIQCPDIVISLLDKDGEKSKDRNTILVCLRDDIEGVLSSEIRKRIYSTLNELSLPINDISMNVKQDIYIKSSQAEFIVEKTMAKLRKARLVITDRLHCMLLCVLTKTPCMFFDNSTGKLSGTYEYIKKLKYISPANETNMEKIICKMMSTDYTDITIDETLIEKYNELIEVING